MPGKELNHKELIKYIESTDSTKLDKLDPNDLKDLLLKHYEADKLTGSIGHHIASSMSSQANRNFLDFIGRAEPELRLKVLGEKDCNKNTIGHLIARYRSDTTVLKFFDLIAEHCSNDIFPLLKVQTDDGWTIGHLIARYRSDTSVLKFFDLIAEHCSNDISSLLKVQTDDGWTIGQLIARYRSDTTVLKFFDLLAEHCSNDISSLLKAQNKNGWTIGHLIARYQDAHTIKSFIKFIRIHCTKHLSDLWQVKNKGRWTPVEVIEENKKGRVLFDLVQNRTNLPYPAIRLMRNYRMEVLQYIDTLAPEKKLDVLSNIYVHSTPLGSFFKLPSTSAQQRKDKQNKDFHVKIRTIKEEAKRHIAENIQVKRRALLDSIGTLMPYQQLACLKQLYNPKTTLGAYAKMQKPGFFGFRATQEQHELYDLYKDIKTTAKAGLDGKEEADDFNPASILTAFEPSMKP